MPTPGGLIWRNDTSSPPWSPFDVGVQRYFLETERLDVTAIQAEYNEFFGPWVQIQESGQFNGKRGFMLSTQHSLAQKMLQAAPKVHRHDFTEQQEQQASVISVSSGTRRRRTKQATPSTSSSGGVLLPRYFTDVGLAKTQACRLESTFEEIDSLIESEEAREHHPVDNQLYRSLEEAISRSYADGFGEQAGEDNAETTTEMLRYSRLKVWAWYIHNGGALVVFAASLLTALLLIIVGQTGIGPAFTAAGWVLAGGTLLTLTVKTCVEERPKRNEDAEEMALRPLRRDGRRPL